MSLLAGGYCLYLWRTAETFQHWSALSQANLRLGVLKALDEGQTNSAVELLEVQLRGDEMIIAADPTLTPRTGEVLEKIKAYEWKSRILD